MFAASTSLQPLANANSAAIVDVTDAVLVLSQDSNMFLLLGAAITTEVSIIIDRSLVLVVRAISWPSVLKALDRFRPF